MDPKQRYLTSFQKSSALQTSMLDDEVLNEVPLETELTDNSSGSDQTTEDFPKTSTPTKKDKQEKNVGGEAIGRSAYDADTRGATSAAAEQPQPTPPSPEQICPVPEPIASITPEKAEVDLRNPDVRPRSAPDSYGAVLLESFGSNSLYASTMKNSEDLEKLKKGYRRQSVRNNMLHSRSYDSVSSLTNSVTSQQEEIQDMQLKLQLIWDYMRQERRHHEISLYNRQITHYVPYDSLKHQGKTSFILQAADLNLQAELFLNGFGSGEGTHLSLRLKAVIGEQDAAVQLPPRCRFEARFVNVDDDEETRKKSSNSEAVEDSHTVEFPKMIEKDVVENEALGYKKNGVVNITLIISWDNRHGCRRS